MTPEITRLPIEYGIAINGWVSWGLVVHPARRRRRLSRNIGITPDPGLMDWLLQHMGPGARWSGPTHFFNWSIRRAMAEEQFLDDALQEPDAKSLRDMLANRQERAGPAASADAPPDANPDAPPQDPPS